MSDWNSYEALLTDGYRQCARLTWRYGTTYYWGAVLLPKPRRKHVYAIYALCRLADDIVDLPNGEHSLEPDAIPAEPDPIPTEPNPTLPDVDEPTFAEPDEIHPEPVEGRAAVKARLEDFAQRFRSSLIAGDSTDPVMAAVVHTVTTCDIDPECFERFFSAMAMDLTTTSYQTWEDLLAYMEGSAAVIGEMMLPVLEPFSPAAKAPARSLGLAFQLTNFIRDIDEDLDRGRVYLPQDDLQLFDVDLGRRVVTRSGGPFWRTRLNAIVRSIPLLIQESRCCRRARRAASRRLVCSMRRFSMRSNAMATTSSPNEHGYPRRARLPRRPA